MADHAVGGSEDTLSTIGLGSCVAIALHDSGSHIGGLAHILLPDESLSRDRSNAAKFPGTAVPLLVDEMRSLGARRITARIAGGASMFAALLPGSGINIGERNTAATRQALAAAGIPLIAEDTGGDYGRSVYLRVADGHLLIRSLRNGDRVL
ncbi:MAG: chemotaxis protein CheD [Gemmatimonadaceae bacterium]